MSAEPAHGSQRSLGAVVRPRSVSERSLVDNVVDFFHDVVPQTCSSQSKLEDKEAALWLRLDKADLTGVDAGLDLSKSVGDSAKSPLVLTIGYGSGVQMWYIPTSGEAQEIYSSRQNPVKVFKLLPNPEASVKDAYTAHRPLAAICDGSGSTSIPFSSLRLLSLRSGEELAWTKTFTSSIGDVVANSRIMVVSLHRRLVGFDSATMEQKFLINSCYPATGHVLNPVCLGSSWLAYAEKQLMPVFESKGGLSVPENGSYTAAILTAAKNVKKGFASLSERVSSTVASTWPERSEPIAHSSIQAEDVSPGIVTIIDISKAKDKVELTPGSDGDNVVAHFVGAHREIAVLEFDPSGMLLFVACIHGTAFNVFRIQPHPAGPSLAAAHHLYTLRRGDTLAKVLNVTFTADSRWVGVCTARGTTHVFAITPYGGQPCARTHVGAHVVNKLSRFQKSAGLDDLLPIAGLPPQRSGLHGTTGGSFGSLPASAVTGGAAGLGVASRAEVPGTYYQRFSGACENPRQPPFPLPDVLDPYGQIKQSVAATTLATLTAAAAAATSGISSQRATEESGIVACFASTRGWLPGMREKADRAVSAISASAESLFIISGSCVLTEHVMEPRAASMASSATAATAAAAGSGTCGLLSGGEARITDDTPLELSTIARAQWSLHRPSAAVAAAMVSSREIRCIPPGCPLLLPREQSSNDSLQCGLSSSYGSKESLSSDSSAKSNDMDEAWLSQVEILTHAGPHRRLWMGPQFKFKTYKGRAAVLSAGSSALLPAACNGGASLADGLGPPDVVCEPVDLQSLAIAHPSLPIAISGHRRTSPASSIDHMLIEAGSYDHSPRLVDRRGAVDVDELTTSDNEDKHLRETLADAMQENDRASGISAAAGAVVYGSGYDEMDSASLLVLGPS